MLDADGGCDSAVTASQICLEKVSWILTQIPNSHSNWKRILVKTETYTLLVWGVVWCMAVRLAY